MEFKDSQTYKNLQNAYEGELKACAKYKIYEEKAKKENYEQIGRIFEETSKNEQEHAQIWLRLLNQGDLPNTLKNLEDAYQGENYEWTKMYQQYALVAEKEGYAEIAKLFQRVASIEKHHDLRYKRLAENIRKSKVFCKNRETIWICMNCGYLYYGMCAPEICPACGYPQGYYKLNCEDY